MVALVSSAAIGPRAEAPRREPGASSPTLPARRAASSSALFTLRRRLLSTAAAQPSPSPRPPLLLLPSPRPPRAPCARPPPHEFIVMVRRARRGRGEPSAGDHRRGEEPRGDRLNTTSTRAGCPRSSSPCRSLFCERPDLRRKRLATSSNMSGCRLVIIRLSGSDGERRGRDSMGEEARQGGRAGRVRVRACSSRSTRVIL